MAKISQKIDLTPVVNEVNDNQLDISTEHQLTRDNLSSAKTTIAGNQATDRSAIEGAVTSEGSATRTAVNNARDNVKSEIVRQTAGSLYALINAVVVSARNTINGAITTAKNSIESTISANRGAVKSVQYGTATIPANSLIANINISAVNPLKSQITFNSTSPWLHSVKFVNSTTVKAEKDATESNDRKVGFCIVEYY